jgi:hypothetical protein
MQEVMPNTLIVLPMAPLALIIDRLHVTAVRWVVQFCFLVLQGQTSGKKRRAHQQAIYNGCVLDYQSQFANRFILINLKFSCGTS